MSLGVKNQQILVDLGEGERGGSNGDWEEVGIDGGGDREYGQLLWKRYLLQLNCCKMVWAQFKSKPTMKRFTMHAFLCIYPCHTLNQQTLSLVPLLRSIKSTASVYSLAFFEKLIALSVGHFWNEKEPENVNRMGALE